MRRFLRSTQADDKASQKRYTRFERPSLVQYGTIVALVLAVVVFSVLRSENFPTLSNLLVVIKAGAVLTIAAVGLTTALVLGDFDLSIGPVAGLAGLLVTGQIINAGWPFPVAILVALVMAVAVGAINGAFVAYVRVSAFIATLGMSSVVTGFIFWYSGGTPVRGAFSEGFYWIGRGSVARIPSQVIIMLVWALILWVMLNHTVLGRHMKAVGGNIEVARLAGVITTRVRMMSFAFCSVSAAIAGIVLSSQLGIGHPQAGDGLLLDAFAASFLGAVTFRKGDFNIAGTVVAVILVSVISNGLTMIGSPTYVQQILKGVILLAAVSVGSLTRIQRRAARA